MEVCKVNYGDCILITVICQKRKPIQSDGFSFFICNTSLMGLTCFAAGKAINEPKMEYDQKNKKHENRKPVARLRSMKSIRPLITGDNMKYFLPTTKCANINGNSRQQADFR